MNSITSYNSNIKCRPSSNILISIKLNSIKTADFEFSSSLRIEEIISEFDKKFPDEKSKEFNLTYLNIILCPICTFKMYNIKSGTTLYLISSNNKEIIIFVKINTRKIIPLSVNPRCTIYSIKKKLLQIHDIDIDKLIYDNQELDDNNELQIYPITNNSIINASKDDKPIKLNIHATLNKYCNVFDFELQTLPTTTISALKEQIISHLKYPKVDATLICNNELLCIDNKTLADHCIENNDYIEFFFYAKKCVDLHIFTNDGKYILLEPLYTDRIINIKEQIHEKEGIPIDRQKLFLNNIELNDKDAIQAYTFGGRLDLVYSLDQCFIISIKDRDQVFPIDAKQNDTIKCIKNKIMSKEKYLIEDQILVFNDQVLNDDQTLSDCSISNGSLLHLHFDDKCMIQISVKYNLSRPPNVLSIIKYAKVAHIKEIINKLTGIPIYQQRIFFNQKLDDYLSIHQYGIENNSILTLMVSFK